MIDKIETISRLFREAETVSFDGERYVLPESLKGKLDSSNVPYEEEEAVVKIRLRSYFSEIAIKYFESLASEIKCDDLQRSFLVVTNQGVFVAYKPTDETLTMHGHPAPEIFDQVNNLVSYFKIFNHFKSDDFCDYFNDGNSEIVIYSSVNGIIKVKYDIIPKIEGLTGIQSKATKLIELSKPVEIAPFFKNGIFTLSKGSGIISLNEVIQQSDDLISITKRDHELVAKSFDFEKFRDSVYKEKEKYFSSIRELVSKIFGQAIGVPISISASVFATYKVKDDVFMLFLVLLAFGLYVLFYVKVQLIYRADLGEIGKDFEEAFSIIKVKSGLSEDLVEAEKTKVQAKINSTRAILNWLIYLVAALSSLVLFYILYEVTVSETFSFVKLFFD